MAGAQIPGRRALVLHVTTGGSLLRAFALDQDRIRIGRDKAADIHLPGPGISRIHCQIVRSEDSFTLLDNGSTNGTLLNGRRVRCQEVQSGDTIQIGSFTFLVLIVSTRADALFPTS